MEAKLTSFPLCWPTGWKRAKYRTGSNFKSDRQRLTVAIGAQRVVSSLR